MTDAEVDANRAAADTGPNDKLTDEQVQESVTSHAERLEDQCDANTHVEGLLDHIDTISAARDLDILRAVVGDDALSYLGYSYGTYLGATYADLFPANVGRLVLDGAVDPTLSSGQISLGQAAGFENALRAYVEDCQRGKNCPLTGDVDDGVKQIQALLDLTVDSPLPTNDAKRPLTYSLAESAVLSLLYDDQYWQYLTSGLAEAMNQGKGTILLALDDALSSRNEDGTYSGNSTEVINAINCLDYPVEGDVASWQTEAHEMEQASPTFGADLSYPELFCQVWDHKSTRERKPIHASGAAPILVIGTTGDPATPYPWAVALAEQHHRPMTLHVVRAFDVMLALRKRLRPRQRWTVHGFRGKPALARQLLDAGFDLSFGLHHNPDSLAITPPDRRHFETDALPEGEAAE